MSQNAQLPDTSSDPVTVDVDEKTLKHIDEFNMITIKDFLLRNIPEPKWVVPGFIKEGVVNAFPGDGGSGKSMFVVNVMYASAMGVPFLGVDLPKMSWIYLDIDPPAQETNKFFLMVNNWWSRRRASIDFKNSEDLMLIDPESILRNRTMRLTMEDKMTDLQKVLHETVVEKIKGFDVLVIDTSIDMVDGDATTSHAGAAFSAGLDRLMHDAGINTAVVLHHTTKDDENMAGSRVFSDKARLVSLLRSDFTERRNGVGNKEHIMTLRASKPADNFYVKFVYNNFNNNDVAISHRETGYDSSMNVQLIDLSESAKKFYDVSRADQLLSKKPGSL